MNEPHQQLFTFASITYYTVKQDATTTTTTTTQKKDYPHRAFHHLNDVLYRRILRSLFDTVRYDNHKNKKLNKIMCVYTYSIKIKTQKSPKSNDYCDNIIYIEDVIPIGLEKKT